MVFQDRNVVYALNSYVWKLLEANLGWSTEQYNGIRPIIPLAQQPELMQTGKPFIVYGAANHQAGHLYQVRKESVAYSIFAKSSTEGTKITNLLALAFEGQDESAANVNEWMEVEDKNRGVSFLSISKKMIEKPEPAEQEGGFSNGFALIEVYYVLDDTGAQLNGFTV